MGISISVKGNTKAVEASLTALPSKSDRAKVTALNTTAKKLMTPIVRAVASNKRVPQKNVRRRLRVIKARRDKLVATIRVFTQQIPAHSLLTPAQLATSLKTRRAQAQTAKGVRAGAHFWQSAFVNVARGHLVVLKREGKPRYPVFAPGVELLPEAETIINRIVQERGRDIFEKEYKRQLERLVKYESPSILPAGGGQ